MLLADANVMACQAGREHDRPDPGDVDLARPSNPWSSPGRVDTRLGRLGGVLLFDLGGGLVVEGGVKTAAVVEDLDVLEEG